MAESATSNTAPGSVSGLRAAWRLAGCTLHGLHALGVVVFLFPRLDLAGRRARIAWWSRTMLRRLDVRQEVAGEFGAGGCLLAANHVSWLDILAIQAACPQARFVSKADVKSWPLLSRLIDSGGTLYLERERKRDAKRVVGQVAAALSAGDVVAVFPEGTTADGRTLLPFHANLLQAAIVVGAPVQPLAIAYSDAAQAVSDATEFVGETTLVRSLWRVASANGLTVRLHALPLQPSAGAERRALAHALRAGIDAALRGSMPGNSASAEAAARAVGRDPG